jgi:hypothetical protein
VVTGSAAPRSLPNVQTEFFVSREGHVEYIGPTSFVVFGEQESFVPVARASGRGRRLTGVVRGMHGSDEKLGAVARFGIPKAGPTRGRKSFSP